MRISPPIVVLAITAAMVAAAAWIAPATQRFAPNVSDVPDRHQLDAVGHGIAAQASNASR